MKYKNLHDINTFACSDGEIYLSGKDEDGENVTIVFDSYELLQWLDVKHIKKQTIKHIKKL
jgi:ABC-type nitrate/sulfonate/bicarbonate transport system ATPase subunit